MKNKNFWLLLMILVPIIGLIFNFYALFLILPLGFFLNNTK